MNTVPTIDRGYFLLSFPHLAEENVDRSPTEYRRTKPAKVTQSCGQLGEDFPVDAPMYPYLPKSWTLGPNIKTITFRELLTHTSGIRSQFDFATSYDDLRGLIAQGIKLSDKVYHYQNHMRFGVFVPQGWRMDLGDLTDPVEQYEAMTAVARLADSLEASRAAYDHEQLHRFATEVAPHFL